MAHPKPIKIFSNVTRGVMFFEGSTITPKVLGIIEASISQARADRIVVARTDQQDSQGRDKRLFKKLNPARVQDVYGNFLTDEGYTIQQVVNYINQQATADLADSQDEFNAYVDPNYDVSNGASTGSSTYPFTDIQTAIDSVSAGASLFIRGVNTITQPLTADMGKSLTFTGGLSTVIGYAEFDPTNTSNIFQLSCQTPVHGAQFKFESLILRNAGNFAVNVINATDITVIDCLFENNGWSGEGLTLNAAASGDTLGFDSTQAELTAFHNLSASNGGAININTGLNITIDDNIIRNGNKNINLIDVGFAEPVDEPIVPGVVNIRNNQIVNNLDNGINFDTRTAVLSTGIQSTRDGSRNVNVSNNSIRDNGGDGIRVKGGADNVIAINSIRGNWCAGIELNSVSNTRVRDLDLTDNNRSSFYADGDPATVDASIVVEGDYIKDGSAFIVEMVNLQISNTDNVSTVIKNGIEIQEEVGNIVDAGAIISIDNIGFLNQDYAITNRANLNNINLSLGDCKFIDSNQTNIRNLAADGSNDFYELPFSNHTTTINEIDVEVNYTNQTIIIKEGVNGETLNSYHIQQLVAELGPNGTIKILEKNTNRLQLGDILPNHVYINGAAATGTAQEVVNQLNGAFTETEPGPSTGASTLVVDFSGTALSGESTNTTSVSGGYQATGNGENNGSVFASFVTLAEALTGAGEYYTFEVTGVGPFAFGLYDFAEPTTSVYSIQSAGISEGTFSYGYQWGYVFGREPVGPWKTVGKNNSYIALDGWTGSDADKFSTAMYPTWNSGATIEMKVGLNADNFIEVAYFNTDQNQYVPIARSSYFGSSLSGYGLLIKMADTETVFTDLRKHQTDYDAIAALSAQGGVEINFRWIESPQGQFHFPLFNAENISDYVDENFLDFFPNITQFTPGSGGSESNVFLDQDPTQDIWYQPETLAYTFSGSPFDSVLSAQWVSPYVTWNEIATSLDETAVPAAFADVTLNFNEGDTVNYPLQPQDTAYTTTIQGDLPPGLSYDGAALSIIGTVGNVPVSINYPITVTRTNSYGSSTGTLTIRVTDTAVDFTDFTEIGGNFVSPNEIQLDYDMLMDYDTILSAGHKLTYSFASGNVPPFIGILNDTGRAAADALTFNAYDLLGSGANDFAGTGKWDLRFVTYDSNIGGAVARDNLVGWDNGGNVVTGSTNVNHDANFELLLDPDDLYLKLYRNDVLMLSSANTYPVSGVQLTFAGYDNQDQSSVYVPTNLAVVLSAFGEVTTPTGFESPLSAGQMETSTLMGVGSAGAVAYLSDGLKVNHRYIIPETWVEANVLPYLGDTDNMAFFGVPKDTANWSDISFNFDFHTAARLFNDNGSRIQSGIQTRGTNPQESIVNVNSLTDASYNYAIEYDGFNLNVIAHQTLGDLSTEVAASSGGTFDRALVYDSQFAGDTLSANILEIPLALAARDGGQVNLTTSGLSQVRIPWDTSSTVLVGEASNGDGVYGSVAASVYDSGGQHAPSSLTTGGMPTLAAGSTYTFIYHPSVDPGDHIELRTTDGTVYTTGSAAFDYSGGVQSYDVPYKGFRWTIPQDVPPLNIYYYNSFTSSYDSGNGLTFSGSTYVEQVSGITLEGPAVNQTGTNLFNDPAVDADGVVWGWLSLDEQLDAGQRLVLDNAFMVDLTDAMPNNSGVFIGLKSSSWTENYRNNSIANATFAGARFAIYKYSASDIRVFGYITGATTIGRNFGTNGIANNGLELAFDMTSSGNNLRLMMRSTGTGYNSSDDVNTTPYADWNSSYKTQTGNQGYGLSALDVMILGDGNVNSSGADGAMDSADVDWTGLSEINVPAAATILTDWNKALDFSGGSERAAQVTQDSNRIPMKMNGQASLITGTPTSGYTSSNTSARPWATACVFKIDGNYSNQHIWNVGSGAGSTDDNIYLRVDANQNLYFGWGRSGAVNECRIATAISSAFWYAIYIGHDGRRWASAGATPGNLYQTFDIRLMSSHDNFATSQDVGTYTQWNQASSTTGGRMDRNITGPLTIGGRGSNRNFHGKVASFVSTTLRRGVAMPTSAEIEKMITDPMQWLNDYKVGNDFRLPWQGNDAGFNFSLNDGSSAYSTQVWLMGDGTNDSYSNMIRNQVNPSDQNYTRLDLISMVSNDIETVSIPGLT